MSRGYRNRAGAAFRERSPEIKSKIGDGSAGMGVRESDGTLTLRRDDAEFYAKQEPKLTLGTNPNLLEGTVYTKFVTPDGKKLMFPQIAHWDRNGIGLDSVERETIDEEMENAGYKNVGDNSKFTERMLGVLDKSSRAMLTKLNDWFEKEVDGPSVRTSVKDAKEYNVKTFEGEGDIRISNFDKPIPVTKSGSDYKIDEKVARKIMEDSNSISDKGIEKVFDVFRKNGFKVV